jgi:hypothetical protein
MRALVCALAAFLLVNPAVAVENPRSLGTYVDVVINGKDEAGKAVIETFTQGFIEGYQRGLFVGEGRVVLQNGLSPNEMCMRTSALDTDKVVNLFHQKIAELKASDPNWRTRDFTAVVQSVISDQFACPKKPR